MSTTIKVHDKHFVPYISSEDIVQKVKELAAQLNKDYEGKRPLFISILNGSFMFSADLFKYLTIEAEICFIKLASYKGTKSSGQVVTAIGLDIDLTNRHVVILEDIIDTGKNPQSFPATGAQPATFITQNRRSPSQSRSNRFSCQYRL